MTGHMVKNRDQLIDKGRNEEEKRARRDLMDIVEVTLSAVDPCTLVKKAVALEGDVLSVGDQSIDLSGIDRIFLAGGGKACFPMARGMWEVLGSMISKGIFNVPQAPEEDLDDRFVFHVAGHPTPDEGGLEGSREIVDLAEEAGENDLFIMLISGGGSALLPLPAGDIALQDLKDLTDVLLASGANINEVNAVRKHVSRIKGGRLAESAYPATVVSLIMSDVVGDPIQSIASGPTSPDGTTFDDCDSIVEKYDMRDMLPKRVRARLEGGLAGNVPETPKAGAPALEKTTNLIVGNNRLALEAARSESEKRGYQSLILTDRMEGEAREVGIFASTILNSINFSKLPMKPPCLVLIGGETTVTLVGPGDGGRNQELALAASRKIEGKGLFLSLATDGRDGPTDSAGTLVDERTCQEAEDLGMSPEQAIADNAEYELLKQLGGHLFTGYTGTNVCDVIFILVP